MRNSTLHTSSRLRTGAPSLTSCGFICLLALCVCFSLPRIAPATAPQGFAVEKAALETVDGSLVVDLSLSVDDEDGLRDLLKDGAVLELSITLDMEQRRILWANKHVVGTVYVSALRHDPLTRDFLVTIPGIAKKDSLRDRNLTRLLHASWRKLVLPLIPLEQLKEADKDADYRVIITLRLQHAEVPPWLEKSLVFWSADVVPKEERILEYRLQ